jgi:hypothetical protein
MPINEGEIQIQENPFGFAVADAHIPKFAFRELGIKPPPVFQMPKHMMFQEEVFVVPDWAEWITQDKDGSIRVWDNEPVRILNTKYVRAGAADKMKIIANGPYEAVKQRVV